MISPPPHRRIPFLTEIDMVIKFLELFLHGEEVRRKLHKVKEE